MATTPTPADVNNDIPLADDAEDASSSGKNVRPAQALPRDPFEEDQEEKARLIAQVLELQNTLDDLSSRVDNVKEESLKLRSENQVLGQYIQNLMGASSVFQSTAPKSGSGSGGQQQNGITLESLSGYFW